MQNGSKCFGQAGQTKAALSVPRSQLLELLQRINFGSIERMPVQSGQPVLDPPPAIVYEVKFGAENGSRIELEKDDFALKSQMIEFFRYLDELGDGVIELLEIKHGLPFRMFIREAAA